MQGHQIRHQRLPDRQRERPRESGLPAGQRPGQATRCPGRPRVLLPRHPQPPAAPGIRARQNQRTRQMTPAGPRLSPSHAWPHISWGPSYQLRWNGPGTASTPGCPATGGRPGRVMRAGQTCHGGEPVCTCTLEPAAPSTEGGLLDPHDRVIVYSALRRRCVTRGARCPAGSPALEGMRSPRRGLRGLGLDLGCLLARRSRRRAVVDGGVGRPAEGARSAGGLKERTCAPRWL